jgi:hypothetical protein
MYAITFRHLVEVLTKTPIALHTHGLIGGGLDYRRIEFYAPKSFGKNSLGFWGTGFSYFFC